MVRLDRFVMLIYKEMAKKYSNQVLYLEGDKQNSSTTCVPIFNRELKKYESNSKIPLQFHGFLLNGSIFKIFINSVIHRATSNNSLTSRFLMLQEYSMVNGLPPLIKSMLMNRMNFSQKQKAKKLFCNKHV